MLHGFSGWKRRTGLIALMAACFFAAAWIRSISHTDGRGFCNVLRMIVSSNGAIYCEVGGGTTLANELALVQHGEFFSTATPYVQHPEPEHKLCWTWSKCGFRFGQFQEQSWCGMSYHNQQNEFEPIYCETPVAFGQVPYWSIVIPLTLLSASLLLSSSRRPTKSEPSQEPAV